MNPNPFRHIGAILAMTALTLCEYGCLLISVVSFINHWTPTLVVFGAGWVIFHMGSRWVDILTAQHLLMMDAVAELDPAFKPDAAPSALTDEDILGIAGVHAGDWNPWTRGYGPTILDHGFAQYSRRAAEQIAQQVYCRMDGHGETADEAYVKVTGLKLPATPAPLERVTHVQGEAPRGIFAVLNQMAKETRAEKRFAPHALPPITQLDVSTRGPYGDKCEVHPTQLDIRAPLSAEELHAIETVRTAVPPKEDPNADLH
jgi:hypothetical protein